MRKAMRLRIGTETRLRLLKRFREETLRCSFCGKGEAEVKKLVAGPHVYICDECVAVCNQIMAERELPNAPVTPD